MRRVCLILLCVVFSAFSTGEFSAVAQTASKQKSKIVTTSLSGKVLDEKERPVVGAVIRIGTDYLWAITDADGRFSVDGISAGVYDVTVTCLGYVDVTAKLDLHKDKDDYRVQLNENSLALDEVVVTAKKAKDGLSTTHEIGRDAINHLQMANVTDFGALLPGGKTTNPDLTVDTKISLREGGDNAGNASFGTAVEVDGVRVGGNASMNELSGSSTRNIAVDNIESVEVITGVPSAEYGDLNSGIVKINTRKGRTPYNISFSLNPRTYQISASKGFDLHKNRGVINASLEWARATKKLTSPYESYTRRAISLSYTNTFAHKLRFELSGSANIGGMNAKNDPDAASPDDFSKVRDNAYKLNTVMTWQVNKPGITNLKFDAFVTFNDNLSRTYKFHSGSSVASPAVHAMEQGYFIADMLPASYYNMACDDSKELDGGASLKYEWNVHRDRFKSFLKAGVQWKTSGNLGQGLYFEDYKDARSAYSDDGYRPDPYNRYPFMHNISVYVEERFSVKVGKTNLELSAGLRQENVVLKGSQYDNLSTWSPRFNAKWSFGEHFAVRGGWGITEKLPSAYILYPQPQYRDINVFSGGNTYVYYTEPYRMEHNASLRWQRNQNSELGIEASAAGFKISLTGYYNKTQFPYEISNRYTPFSYNVYENYPVPDGAAVIVDPKNGNIKVDGVDVPVKVRNSTFVKTTYQDNGADIHRAGAELVVEFPEIRPLRTTFRVDAAYNWTKTHEEQDVYYYNNGLSHSSLPDRSYQYVGIYAGCGTSASDVSNGRITHGLDANVTMITHIPQAKIIITCRVEMSILNRFRNTSSLNGHDYAVKGEDGYYRVYPVRYMDLDGKEHDFNPATDADKPEFRNLILTSNNIHAFDQDGYGFYMSANLSVTKEIGKHVSISAFANNFTNSRMAVTSMATGVSAIFTPAFYYGLTCRLKF